MMPKRRLKSKTSLTANLQRNVWSNILIKGSFRKWRGNVLDLCKFPVKHLPEGKGKSLEIFNGRPSVQPHTMGGLLRKMMRGAAPSLWAGLLIYFHFCQIKNTSYLVAAVVRLATDILLLVGGHNSPLSTEAQCVLYLACPPVCLRTPV